MTDRETYQELLSDVRFDPSQLPDRILAVQREIDERKAKIERLQYEIDQLQQRGEPTDTQRGSLQVVQEEVNVLRERLAELEQRAAQPIEEQLEASGNLVIGGIAQVAQNGGLSLELRTRPSLTESGVIDRHPPGEQLTLLDGPEHVDGHTWWRVRRIDGREGWIVSDGLEGRPA